MLLNHIISFYDITANGFLLKFLCDEHSTALFCSDNFSQKIFLFGRINKPTTWIKEMIINWRNCFALHSIMDTS